MPKTESAYLSHYIPGRARFRILGRRGDEKFFSILEEKLRTVPGIETVQVSALTGSVLVTHGLGSVDDIGTFAKAQHLFEVGPEPDLGLPIGERIATNVTALDQQFKELSGGAFDHWSLDFLILFGMAMYQMLKGNIAAPATTLLWYAFGTLLMAQTGRKNPRHIAEASRPVDGTGNSASEPIL